MKARYMAAIRMRSDGVSRRFGLGVDRVDEPPQAEGDRRVGGARDAHDEQRAAEGQFPGRGIEPPDLSPEPGDVAHLPPEFPGDPDLLPRHGCSPNEK